MKDMDELRGLAEGTLRRALQLDPDERLARFDAAAIAMAAGHRTPLERLLRTVRGVALVGVSLGIESVVALAAFNVIATLDLSEPLGLALSVVAFVAQQVVAVGALTASPSVGVAALAAAVFATLYERSIGRESRNVRAS